jgi:hypothetical protein
MRYPASPSFGKAFRPWWLVIQQPPHPPLVFPTRKPPTPVPLAVHASIPPRPSCGFSSSWLRCFFSSTQSLRDHNSESMVRVNPTPSAKTAPLSKVRWRISCGDITQLGHARDVLVNAANETLEGSFQRCNEWHFVGRTNVDMAMQKAAGRDLLLACLGIEPDANGLRCPPGPDARVLW